MKPEFNPELISAFLDGEITSEEDRDLLERQFAESPADAETLNDFRELGNLLRELPAESTPPGLLEAVHNQIERETLLARPAQHPVRGRWSLRPMQLIASVSILMLLVSVGTFYYMQNHLDTLSGGNQLVYSEAHTAADGFALNDNIETALEDGNQLAFRSASIDDSVAKPESFSTNLVIIDGKMLENRLAKKTARQTRSYSLSGKTQPGKTLSSKTLPGKPLPALAEGEASHGIPPLPSSLSRSLFTLAASPKLHGVLEPGELVRYVSQSRDNQNISVVELSVVDVEEAFGTIQVLLTSNQIVPASQIRKLEGLQEDQQIKLTVDELNQIKKEGMIAFYVEASQEQVLSSLVQVNQISNVREVYFGDVPNLKGSAYVVESLAKNSAQRFDINKVDSMNASSDSNSNGKGSFSLLENKQGVSFDKKSSAQAGPVPNWSFSNNLVQNNSSSSRFFGQGILEVPMQRQKEPGSKAGRSRGRGESKSKAIEKKWSSHCTGDHVGQQSGGGCHGSV
ncbi:MAG: hypothetical protein JKY95_16970 [Planctomycetaceae bacterium]|nr:hypothetical protein [Planctomycetaceae bacterium]